MNRGLGAAPAPSASLRSEGVDRPWQVIGSVPVVERRLVGRIWHPSPHYKQPLAIAVVLIPSRLRAIMPQELTTAVFGTIFTKRGAAGRPAVDLELTPRQSDSRPRQSCAYYGRRAAVARRRERSICVNCVRLKSTHMALPGRGPLRPV
jgi:hypothetical protein